MFFGRRRKKRLRYSRGEGVIPGVSAFAKSKIHIYAVCQLLIPAIAKIVHFLAQTFASIFKIRTHSTNYF